MDKLARGGVSLAFEDVGRGAPPMLLIHDLGRDRTAFRPQLEHLRRRHRVVAVDLRGHGQSDPLVEAYTLACFADDLAWLCFQLGVYRPVAVGQGIGGLIAIALAASYPDLLAAVVVLDASAIVTAPHLATRTRNEWRDALAGDSAEEQVRCDVPVLYLTGDVAGRHTRALRRLCSHVVESVGPGVPGQLDHGAGVERVNAIVDAFVAFVLARIIHDGESAGEELPEGLTWVT